MWVLEDASKEAGLEVYAKNIKYIFMSHEQNARKNHSLRWVINTLKINM
jgi:hypothetical protein